MGHHPRLYLHFSACFIPFMLGKSRELLNAIQVYLNRGVGTFTDRADPATLCTWEEFERHHRDAFIERITKFVELVGS